METLKFKTTIKCGACLATVTPHLNGLSGLERWEVDLKSPDRTLTVETAGASAADVVRAVTEAGFRAEAL